MDEAGKDRTSLSDLTVGKEYEVLETEGRKWSFEIRDDRGCVKVIENSWREEGHWELVEGSPKMTEFLAELPNDHPIMWKGTEWRTTGDWGDEVRRVERRLSEELSLLFSTQYLTSVEILEPVPEAYNATQEHDADKVPEELKHGDLVRIISSQSSASMVGLELRIKSSNLELLNSNVVVLDTKDVDMEHYTYDTFSINKEHVELVDTSLGVDPVYFDSEKSVMVTGPIPVVIEPEYGESILVRDDPDDVWKVLKFLCVRPNGNVMASCYKDVMEREEFEVSAWKYYKSLKDVSALELLELGVKIG